MAAARRKPIRKQTHRNAVVFHVVFLELLTCRLTKTTNCKKSPFLVDIRLFSLEFYFIILFYFAFLRNLKYGFVAKTAQKKKSQPRGVYMNQCQFQKVFSCVAFYVLHSFVKDLTENNDKSLK